MQQQVTAIIAHMAKSHREMARVLEAKRHSIANMAQVVTALPSEHLSDQGIPVITGNAVEVNKSITSYLNSLADLVEALADNLEMVVKELNDGEHEE